MSCQIEIDDNGDTKEGFCGACASIPLALAGIGIAGVGAKKGSTRKMKKVMLWVGLSITLISVIIAIIYLKSCKSCR